MCSRLTFAVVGMMMVFGPQHHGGDQKAAEGRAPAGLKGYVREAPQKPVPNAVLQLYDKCSDSADPCKDVVSSTSSAADGSFSLSIVGLKPGLYGLKASKAQHFSMMWVPVNIPPDPSKILDLALPPDGRTDSGQIDVSSEQAKAIFMAAKVDHDQQLLFLSARILQNSSTTEVERQFYAAQARDALEDLSNKSEVTVVLTANPWPVSKYNVVAINRITGEEYKAEGTPSEEIVMGVPAVGTYDIHLFASGDSQAFNSFNNVHVEAGMQSQIYITQGAGGGLGYHILMAPMMDH